MIGSDDIFACFIAGNVFTWDNWYKEQSEDHTFQEGIDTILNIVVFLWLGAACPWKLIADSSILTSWRIFGLVTLVLLFRRLPSVWLLHGSIWQMKAQQQALFVGFFGPIGVSAMFYLHKTLEYIETSEMNKTIGKQEVERLGQHMTVVVWTLVIASVVSVFLIDSWIHIDKYSVCPWFGHHAVNLSYQCRTTVSSFGLFDQEFACVLF